MLIVDECLPMLKGMEHVFKRDFEVLLASDGCDAMMVFNEHRPDIVLLELAIPKKDGLLVLEEIKSSHPFVPVAVLTVIDTAEHALKALKLGADEYLTKPVSLGLLKSTVRNLLSNDGIISRSSIWESGRLALFEDFPRYLLRGRTARDLSGLIEFMRGNNRSPTPTTCE